MNRPTAQDPRPACSRCGVLDGSTRDGRLVALRAVRLQDGAGEPRDGHLCAWCFALAGDKGART